MTGSISSGSPEFDKLRAAFEADPDLRTETQWAFRLAVETYNPSDRGLRFITGGIGEWIITLAAYKAGIVTMPDGHNADGHDTAALLAAARELWSVKTSYQAYSRSQNFTISNGQGGAGAGFRVPTVFVAPGLPGIVYVHPDLHQHVVAEVVSTAGETKVKKFVILEHAEAHPECVIPVQMPVNPNAAIKNPALEAVRIIVDNSNFPRLRSMFADAAAAAAEDRSILAQIERAESLLARGSISQEEYRAIISKVTGLSA